MSNQKVTLYNDQLPIEVTESGFCLQLTDKIGDHLWITLNFNDRPGVGYPITDPARVVEFRAMVERLDIDQGAPQRWDGEHFLGWARKDEGQLRFGFYERQNGIVLTFSQEDWKTFQDLFKRAWEYPAVRRAFEALANLNPPAKQGPDNPMIVIV